MSTERQVYSLGYQSECIARYAADRGYEIVKTFADPGRSGRRLSGRPALQQLLVEVLSGSASFRSILVYDISRWGRFQDSDEAAHYEFLCRNAGIAVHYCAEQFENDGSMATAILKNLKRVMAAEYSRDLSERVHANHTRLTRLGHRMGGNPPYGFRRMMIDSSGRHRGILAKGESKSNPSFWVTLVPGPAHEVAVIRKIFELAATTDMRLREIADHINAQNIDAARTRPWTGNSILIAIRNEAYAGTLVFAQRTNRHGKKNERTPTSAWLRIENQFTPLIDRATFEAAQGRKTRARPIAQDVLLAQLRVLLARHGYLSQQLIRDDANTASLRQFCKIFGRLSAAYRLIGYSRRVRLLS